MFKPIVSSITEKQLEQNGSSICDIYGFKEQNNLCCISFLIFQFAL